MKAVLVFIEDEYFLKMTIFIEHKYFLYNVNENWLQMQKITPDKEHKQFKRIDYPFTANTISRHWLGRMFSHVSIIARASWTSIFF